MRIFISYARVDKPLVDQLVAILRDANLGPWFDHSLLPGQDWQAELLKAIKVCNRFLYALTPESLASQWCQWEFAEAVTLGKPIIPVLLQSNIELPMSLRKIQYADFSQGVTSQATAKLISGVYKAAQIPVEEVEIMSGTPEGLPAQAEEFTPKTIITMSNAHHIRKLAILGNYPAAQLIFSLDGIKVISASPYGHEMGGQIKLWDVQTMSEVLTLLSFENDVNVIELSPDGKLLAYALSEEGDTPDFGVYNLEENYDSRVVQMNDDDMIWDMTFSLDKRKLFVTTLDRVRIWFVELGYFSSAELTEIQDQVWAVKSSPDGTLLATGESNGHVKIWDNFGRYDLHTFVHHDKWVQEVKFSPNSLWLASGCVDGTIKIWDVDRRVEKRTLLSHRDTVASLSWSPDSKLLASASNDNNVKVWDVERGIELIVLKGAGSCVAFSPLGTLIVTGGTEIALWGLSSEKTDEIQTH